MSRAAAAPPPTPPALPCEVAPGAVFTCDSSLAGLSPPSGPSEEAESPLGDDLPWDDLLTALLDEDVVPSRGGDGDKGLFVVEGETRS
jgi:hypothetical protein